MAGKAVNKAKLQERLYLEVDPNVPMIGMEMCIRASTLPENTVFFLRCKRKTPKKTAVKKTMRRGKATGKAKS